MNPRKPSDGVELYCHVLVLITTLMLGSGDLTRGSELPLYGVSGGVLPHPFQLSLSFTNTNPGADVTIRYTLNGSAPGPTSTAYTAPILITDPGSRSNVLSMIPGTSTANQHTDGWKPPRGLVPKATVVRSQIHLRNQPSGPSVAHTYFPTSVVARHPGLPIISLAIATNELFHYDTGIYVLGKEFDDYVRAHPAEPLTGHTPANYTQRGPAWERPAYLEWFEPGGTRTLAQSVVIDIQGQSSRSFRQKSLGLKAFADDFSPDDFRYPFFPGLTNRMGEPMTRFDHLRLANSGNDWAYTLFRDALCHELARHTRVDTLAYRPVVVYLDGEFWGIHNLREQQDPDFVSDHYDIKPSEVVICESSGTLMDGVAGDESHYQRLIRYVETNDMTQPTHYATVGKWMDIENFITYQASEIYFGNADWPHNNIRFWRKRTKDFEPEAPYGHDGRWRWLLFDVDLGYGHAWSGGVSENSLALAKAPGGRIGGTNHWSTTLFRHLLANSQFRNQFINTTADLLNSSFKESRATNLVNELQARIAPTMADHIARWRTANDSTNGWRSEVNILRFFASQRAITVRQHLIAEFKLGGFANLTLDMEPRGGGEFRLNTLRIHEQTEGSFATNAFPWRGTYFRGVPIELQAVARPGYRFTGWKGFPELGTNPVRTLNLTSPTNLIAQFHRSLTPHPLQSAPYILSEWARQSPAGSYPPSMILEQSDQPDPDLFTPLTSEWTGAYNLNSRSRINGLDSEGIGFINTSDPQPTPGAGYVGSAVVAINSLGVSNIQVSFMAGTVATNEQIYALRLQVAVGDSLFQDVVQPNGSPVEYRRNIVQGHQAVVGPVTLPASADNRPFVRIRWKYYRTQPGKGSRAYLRLDDIWISPVVEAQRPSLFASPAPTPGILQLEMQSTPRTRWWLEVSRDLNRWDRSEFSTLTDLTGAARFTWPSRADPGVNFFRVRSDEGLQ